MRLLFFIIVLLINQIYGTSPWNWDCIGEGSAAKCVKKQSTDGPGLTFRTCRLTCGPYGSMLPIPTYSTVLGSDVYRFIPSAILHSVTNCPAQNVCDLLEEAVDIMKQTMKMYNPDYEDLGDEAWVGPWQPNIENNTLRISLSVTQPDQYLTLFTNESYTLDVRVTSADFLDVIISAPSFFGARHALETMTQLVDYDEQFNCYQMINSASIEDEPVYRYRGIILDTSRNFYPVKTLKKTLDAMSYNKLNTFHWHITDTASFPMVLTSLPNMSFYGAYDDKSVYSSTDIKDLISYAQVRGIRILPEFDAPAHAGHGWEWAEENGMGEMVVCLYQKPWELYCAEPPCGQLNLANDNMYNTLEALYNEMVSIFNPVDLFHFGGDEVNLECWRSSDEIIDWMISRNRTLDDDSFYLEWSIFQEKVRQMVIQANGGAEMPSIIWTSSLTEEGRASQYLSPEDYIIQIWSDSHDPLIGDLVQDGFNVIMSNYDVLYLDCGRMSWISDGMNWCEYSGWQKIYDHDIRKLVSNQTGSSDYDSQILGGEAAVWSEEADRHNLDYLLWPRGSALAERLWTDPESDYSSAFERMVNHRERLVRRGIDADRLRPEWCAQNQGECN